LLSGGRLLVVVLGLRVRLDGQFHDHRNFEALFIGELAHPPFPLWRHLYVNDFITLTLLFTH
jgi:hypothetical protein